MLLVGAAHCTLHTFYTTCDLSCRGLCYHLARFTTQFTEYSERHNFHYWEVYINTYQHKRIRLKTSGDIGLAGHFFGLAERTRIYRLRSDQFLMSFGAAKRIRLIFFSFFVYVYCENCKTVRLFQWISPRTADKSCRTRAVLSVHESSLVQA